ncbi:unnamed protein product [Allacma fusca]|uniref:Uncharacterized protein n=1 Tax=Allacma fusca TaxID=39272 RepID=A0A8J2KX37_9HEXA|nr:unnamed protein product [Allacma fusca]
MQILLISGGLKTEDYDGQCEDTSTAMPMTTYRMELTWAFADGLGKNFCRIVLIVVGVRRHRNENCMLTVTASADIKFTLLTSQYEFISARSEATLENHHVLICRVSIKRSKDEESFLPQGPFGFLVSSPKQ